MGNHGKKTTLFRKFSQNLDWFQEHPAIEFNPPFTEGYLCPLCFNLFHENELDNSQENFLTLEDIPPKSLGGKPLALTCKDCNSKSGHDLDVHILNRLLELDSHSFLPNSSSKATFELNGQKVNGVFDVQDNGTLRLDLQPNRSNPSDFKGFMSDFFAGQTWVNPMLHPGINPINQFQSPEFSLELKKISDEDRAGIALLRIAYLLLFAKFGNSIFAIPGLFKVREQIRNPDEEILRGVYWLNYTFPPEMEGVSIITLPKEMQSILVVFSLKTKSKSRQFAIVLPGSSGPGLNVYQYIEEKLCSGDGSEFVNLMLEKLPDLDYVSQKEKTFALIAFWQEYTKPDYEPNLPPE